MKIHEPEFTKLAEQVARRLKAEHLARMPGMDSVAVAMNSSPTYDEHMQMKRVLRTIEELGYEIHKA